MVHWSDDLDLWPAELNMAQPVTPVMGTYSLNLNFLQRFHKIGAGVEQTDG